MLTGTVMAQGSPDSLDVDRIIAEIDSLYRSKSSYSELQMEIVTPHWQRTLEMKAWTEGLEKTFIRIIEPKKEEGVGTLRIGNEMWNYMPNTNKVIKIPPSMMMSSWMGSDFTNDDLVKEFSLYEDYKYEQVFPEDAVDSLVYVNCIPREDLAVVWGNIVVSALRDSYIPVWQKYYDEDGELMRVLYYSDITTFADRRLPATMKMVPQDEEGHTVMHYRELEFDIDLEQDLFTLRNLRSWK
jgi:outer membrane lipoprotein-sorting protein